MRKQQKRYITLSKDIREERQTIAATIVMPHATNYSLLLYQFIQSFQQLLQTLTNCKWQSIVTDLKNNLQMEGKIQQFFEQVYQRLDKQCLQLYRQKINSLEGESRQLNVQLGGLKQVSIQHDFCKSQLTHKNINRLQHQFLLTIKPTFNPIPKIIKSESQLQDQYSRQLIRKNNRELVASQKEIASNLLKVQVFKAENKQLKQKMLSMESEFQKVMIGYRQVTVKLEQAKSNQRQIIQKIMAHESQIGPKLISLQNNNKVKHKSLSFCYSIINLPIHPLIKLETVLAISQELVVNILATKKKINSHALQSICIKGRRKKQIAVFGVLQYRHQPYSQMRQDEKKNKKTVHMFQSGNMIKDEDFQDNGSLKIILEKSKEDDQLPSFRVNKLKNTFKGAKSERSKEYNFEQQRKPESIRHKIVMEYPASTREIALRRENQDLKRASSIQSDMPKKYDKMVKEYLLTENKRMRQQIIHCQQHFQKMQLLYQHTKQQLDSVDTAHRNACSTITEQSNHILNLTQQLNSIKEEVASVRPVELQSIGISVNCDDKITYLELVMEEKKKEIVRYVSEIEQLHKEIEQLRLAYHKTSQHLQILNLKKKLEFKLNLIEIKISKRDEIMFKFNSKVQIQEIDIKQDQIKDLENIKRRIAEKRERLNTIIVKRQQIQTSHRSNKSQSSMKVTSSVGLKEERLKRLRSSDKFKFYFQHQHDHNNDQQNDLQNDQLNE